MSVLKHIGFLLCNLINQASKCYSYNPKFVKTSFHKTIFVKFGVI